MKRKPFYFFLLLSGIFFAQKTHSQTITGLSVIPASPTTNDSVKLIVQTSFSWGGCWLSYQNTSSAGNNNYIDGYYCTGLLAVICNRIDTFNLGLQSVGLHNAYFTLWHHQTTGLDTTCSPFLYADDDSLVYTVSQASAVLKPGKTYDAITIFPDDENNIIRVNFNHLTQQYPVSIKLIDINGRSIRTILIETPNAELTIPITDIQPGVYLLQLTGKENFTENHKFVWLK